MSYQISLPTGVVNSGLARGGDERLVSADRFLDRRSVGPHRRDEAGAQGQEPGSESRCHVRGAASRAGLRDDLVLNEARRSQWALIEEGSDPGRPGQFLAILQSPLEEIEIDRGRDSRDGPVFRILPEGPGRPAFRDLGRGHSILRDPERKAAEAGGSEPRPKAWIRVEDRGFAERLL